MKQILFVILPFVAIASYGQHVGTTYFAKNGKKSDKTNSYYYLTGKKIPRLVNGEELDTVTVYSDSAFSYYSSSDKIRSKEFYNKKGNRQGSYKEYFENGMLKEIGSYNNGRKVGNFTYYYPYGALHDVINFQEEDNKPAKSTGNDFMIINYWDSLGTQLVTNGNGFCRCYFLPKINNNIIREDGVVVDGVRDLQWKTYSNDTLSFKEEYSHGEFLGGIRYDDGREIPYKEIEKPAEYKRGIKKLYRFLSNNIKYPTEARRYGIQGKVYVQFVVDKDGSLTDFKILKSPSKILDEEALRLIQLSGNWIPGMIRGKAVKSKFVLPLTFKLSR